MFNKSAEKSNSNSWLVALVSIFAVSVLCYIVIFLIDTAGLEGISFWKIFTSAKAHESLSNMPEVVAGVLGITITVVAIIVELAANRYTPRITELFFKSPVNLSVLGFFVVSCLLCTWVSITRTNDGFYPRIGTFITIVAISVCLLLLLPYFAYVFNFLSPKNVIDKMGSSTFAAINYVARTKTPFCEKHKAAAITGIEQLSDVALNAIEHKDKGLSMHAVNTMGIILQNYLAQKDSMPDKWFLLHESLRDNSDFISMGNTVLNDIEKKRYWFEMKILRQYQMLYQETLGGMRDINYLIAINTKKAGEFAIKNNEEDSLSLCVKFFNTFLRSTINKKDVRTAYNVFNHYRLLAVTAMKNKKSEVAVEIAERFKYYGQLGFSMGIPFTLETAAYDLCAVNELAFKLKAPCVDDLLEIFLDVDKEAEKGHELEASLRGVRKAQIKLATFYLINDATSYAKKIFYDMKYELPERMDSIRKELFSIKDQDFWEISDRGINFDYLEPERRRMLDVFFGWFTDSNNPEPSKG